MTKEKELAQQIIRTVGGKENISSATNCMTRLRLTLMDKSKMDLSALQKLSGVLGVVEAPGQLQNK